MIKHVFPNQEEPLEKQLKKGFNPAIYCVCALTLAIEAFNNPAFTRKCGST